MYTTEDIYPVSDFNRKPSEHIRRLHEDKRTEVLTVNGKAAVVMLDPEVYDQLISDAELARRLTRMTEAEMQFGAGKIQSAAEVFTELKSRLKDKYPNA